MKKNIIISIFLLFMSVGTAVGQFRVGFLAGGSVSRFIYEDEAYKEQYKTSYGPGYHLGVMLNYRVNKLYSLQTELSFMQKGIDVRYEDEYVNVRNSASYKYLSAPVLLRFSTHKNIRNQHVELYVNVGPEINYWLGGSGVLTTTEPAEFVRENEMTYKVSFNNDQEYGDHMVVKDPYRVQMAVAGGGGLIFDLGRSQNIGVDLRGSFGIGKSFHGKTEGGDYGLDLYSENLAGVHHALSITASYFANFDMNSFFRKGKSVKK